MHTLKTQHSQFQVNKKPVAICICISSTTANKEPHPIRRITVKQILCADRAGGQVPAFVLLELSQVHAAVALHAVTHISAQAFANAAEVAEGAVVDVAPWLIVKELTDVAVVARHTCVAGTALSCKHREI